MTNNNANEGSNNKQINGAEVSLMLEESRNYKNHSTLGTIADKNKDLRVKQSFSRPKVSNDNPFSESHFRHLKYSPNFPARFGCIEDARAFCRSFFVWYNEEHFHEGLNMFTPAMVHGNRIEEFAKRRQNVLDAAYQKFPNRFVKGRPTVKRPPKAVWINPPTKEKGTCSDTACSVNIIGGVQ